MATSTMPRLRRAYLAVRTVRIARQLAAAAPGAAIIRTTPVWTDANSPSLRLKTLVTLDDANGRPVEADIAAHRLARDLLRQSFSSVDWSRAHRYEVRTGRLSPLVTSFGPAELTAGGPR